jgi:hypothetical protein
MKKLGLFFAAIALSTGASFAQQPLIALTPGQTDVSVVFQTGEGHEAKVIQQGTFNNSSVQQESQLNSATVNQVNTVGSLIPTQSDIKQTGEQNIATVNQISTLDLSSINNESFIFYLPLTATILQSGSYNTAQQTQVKFMNTATITQTGGENVAIQEQDVEMTDGYIGSFNTADINQAGYGNDAFQYQNGWLNTASILQPGNLNTAEQHQDLYSMGNNALVTQAGNSNESYQTQVGYLNKGTVTQNSDNNQAAQEQDSNSLITFESESIDDVQDELSLNDATIWQDGGEDNNAVQIQRNLGLSVANEAISCQLGSKNTSGQNQDGGANYSLIQQKGCENAAFVNQGILMPR